MTGSLIIPKVTNLRFSRLVNTFERNGIVALYHSISHEVIFFSSDEHASFKQILDSEMILSSEDLIRIKPMIDKSFIVPVVYNETDILDKIRTKMLGKPSFDVLYLLLTDACNMKCKYCFIENAMPQDRIFSMMSSETAINAIRFFAKMQRRNPIFQEKPIIFFYGGGTFS